MCAFPDMAPSPGMAAGTQPAARSEARAGLGYALLVEEKPICRMAISQVLNEVVELSGARTCGNLSEAALLAADHAPRLVLIDLFSINYDFKGLSRFLAAHPETPAVVIDDLHVVGVGIGLAGGARLGGRARPAAGDDAGFRLAVDLVDAADEALLEFLVALGDVHAAQPERRICGAVYVSCSGRGGPHFGGPSAELQIVRHALGDVPLVGFFAGGEIAHHHLYGYTGVLTVFVDRA